MLSKRITHNALDLCSISHLFLGQGLLLWVFYSLDSGFLRSFPIVSPMIRKANEPSSTLSSCNHQQNEVFKIRQSSVKFWWNNRCLPRQHPPASQHPHKPQPFVTDTAQEPFKDAYCDQGSLISQKKGTRSRRRDRKRRTRRRRKWWPTAPWGQLTRAANLNKLS